MNTHPFRLDLLRLVADIDELRMKVPALPAERRDQWELELDRMQAGAHRLMEELEDVESR